MKKKIVKIAAPTPGPYVVEPRQWDHGASIAIVSPTNGYIVAVVPYDEDIQTVDEPNMDTVKRHPDEIPNAHLLAASWAMREALIDCQRLIGHMMPYVGKMALPDYALLNEAPIKAKAALAAAAKTTL